MQAFADGSDDVFIEPTGIADAVDDLVHQQHSARTFEPDPRPLGESW